VNLSEELKNYFLDQIYHIGEGEDEKDYRGFAYAYKDIESDNWEKMQAEFKGFHNEHERENIECDMIFVIAFGLEDNLRVGVQESIKKLRDANIEVRMISGDSIHTAKRTAVLAEIIDKDGASNSNVCMKGDDLMEIL
jgi:magnesium-transporting ATPase (P-type)